MASNTSSSNFVEDAIGCPVTQSSVSEKSETNKDNKEDMWNFGLIVRN